MLLFHKKVLFRSSEKQSPAHCERLGEVDGSQIVSATVVLRRIGNRVPAIEPRLSRPEFAASFGADVKDVALVQRFAHHYHLTVAEVSLEKRRVVLRGKARDMGAAFDVEWAQYRDTASQTVFRGRSGSLRIPADLQDAVIAVLGLDDRQAAFAHFIKGNAQASTAGTFSPLDLARLYNFPAGMDGTGQTIGIVELGGGFTPGDLQSYFTGLGLKPPVVTAFSVDGGMNAPGDPADGEVELDIQVAGAIAPGANIVVYFAPNTDQGFVDAITDAVHDAANKPSVISVSWGASEDSWTQQARTAMDAALQDAAMLGVTVTAASGDNGSTDGGGDNLLHVDFPASSPYALACGGTTLVASAAGEIASETVWNVTGGGVSTAFPLPSYQRNAAVPLQGQTNFAGRGVPDVAGNADPATGYQVLVGGQPTVVGGTSAVAPLWASLIALLNQSLGSSVGFLQPVLYAMAQAGFQDIQDGNNDDGGLGFYSAGVGWDACTGLGSPNGTALLKALTPQ